MSELKWGVIGCGAIAGDFVDALLKHGTKPHKVVAAAARDLNRAQQFLQKHNSGGGQAYGSYEELLADEAVDIVYLANLNHDHTPLVIKALDANKHVLSEKSMACNVKEMKQIIERAKTSDKFVMEAIWTRFQPAWRKLESMVKSGELGRLRVYHANFGVCLPPGRRALEHGESPITDIGVYVISTALHMFGDERPASIDIVGERDADGVDAWANITMKWKDGGHAIIYFNGNTFTPNKAFLAFEKGRVEVDAPFWATKKLVLQKGFLKSQGEEVMDFSKDDDSTKYNYANSDLLAHEADFSYDYIHAGKRESDILPLESSLKVHEIITQVREKLGVVYAQDA